MYYAFHFKAKKKKNFKIDNRVKTNRKINHLSSREENEEPCHPCFHIIFQFIDNELQIIETQQAALKGYLETEEIKKPETSFRLYATTPINRMKKKKKKKNDLPATKSSI